jgi:hypothetical protein
MKIYIAVLDEVPDHMVPVLVAHSMLGAHISFKDLPTYRDWLRDSFRKCVVKVNRKEFKKIQESCNCFIGYENTVLNGEGSCIVTTPYSNTDRPNVLIFAKLWKPN